MSIRVGDAVFLRAGQPAMVRERDPVTGQLQLDTSVKAVQTDMRHGYLNGIEPEQRDALYGLLDEVKGQSEDPEQRVELLRAKLTELEKLPQNYVLARYVRAELAHLMNTHDIRPRLYGVGEDKIR